MKTFAVFLAALVVFGLLFYGLDAALFSLQGAPLPFEGKAAAGGH